MTGPASMLRRLSLAVVVGAAVLGLSAGEPGPAATTIRPAGQATASQSGDEPSGRHLPRCGRSALRGATVARGCRIAVDDGVIRFSTLTLFGDQPLGDCTAQIEVSLKPRRGVAMTVVDVDIPARPDSRSPAGACGDIHACTSLRRGAAESLPPIPWRGRVTAIRGSSLTVGLEACFDTCLGRFEGRLSLAVVSSRAGRVSLRASSRALAGDGLELDGRWTGRVR